MAHNVRVWAEGNEVFQETTLHAVRVLDDEPEPQLLCDMELNGLQVFTSSFDLDADIQSRVVDGVSPENHAVIGCANCMAGLFSGIRSTEALLRRSERMRNNSQEQLAEFRVAADLLDDEFETLTRKLTKLEKKLKKAKGKKPKKSPSDITE